MLERQTGCPDYPEPCDNVMLSSLSLAMAYVPMQVWEKPYDADVALHRGTLFHALDKPFIGEEAVPRGR